MKTHFLHTPTAGLLPALALSLSASALAADWPQYRADATRSSYTAETLPSELTLDWVRQPRHQPHRAWVGRLLSPSRMKFDWSYTPVISGDTLFFGSSADHQVHALDAKTGEEKWRFVTSGPVRLAPAVWQQRVLAVSDDGYLYCLNAATGSLHWKLRAGPSDQLMIGNGRLVSRWAARGGPAIRDGIVYFAAGPWPVEGTYVYAVDIADGSVIWRNDASGALEIEHPHMGSIGRGGALSQGYLAASADDVFVSTGRSTPAVYDRKTGRLRHFHLSRYGGKTPWGVGGGDTVVTDEVYFNGGYVFDTATGLRYDAVRSDDRWTPYVFHDHKYHGQFLDGPRRDVALSPDGPLFFIGSKLHGGTLANKTHQKKREAQVLKYARQLEIVERLTVKGKAEPYHMERIDNAPTVKIAWNADLGADATAMIVAGPTVYLGAKDRVLGLDTATKKVTWSGKVDGTVMALAAANGRLYAATDTGAISCFAENGRGVEVSARESQSPYPDGGPLAHRAAAILEKTGIKRGYALILGDDPSAGRGRAGELAYQLTRQSELYVIAVTPNATVSARARKKLDAAGVYGTRVTVIEGPLSEDMLPPYFANVVVAPELLEHGLTNPQLMEHLAPQRGTLCTVEDGELEYRSRPAMPGAGTWTHSLGDSGNSLCSDDDIVGGPLGLLWFDDEDMLTIDRHGKNPAPLFADGVMIRAAFDEIKAVDAYNGTTLWRRKIPGLLRDYQGGSGVGGVAMGSMCCIDAGTLFVRHENTCLALDLQTGEQLARHTAPAWADGRPGTWSYVAADRGILFGTLANERQLVRGQHGNGGAQMQGPMERHFTESLQLFALDAETGEQKWIHIAKESIRNNSIAIGNGRVYLIDRPVATIDLWLRTDVAKAIKEGKEVPDHPLGTLICLDAATGREVWSNDTDIFGTTLALSKKHDLLVMSYNTVGRTVPSDSKPRQARCYHAATGKEAWTQKGMGFRPILSDDIIYSYPRAHDLFTGKPRPLRRDAASNEQGCATRVQGKGIGCGTPIGSRNMLFIRSGTVGYYDIENDSGWLDTYGSIRSGCWINAIPVGGIVLVPDDTRACRCSFPNQASIALYQRGIRPPMVRPVAEQKNWQQTQQLSPFELDFTDALQIEILPPNDKVDALRYTLDGSIPDVDSPLYTAPMTINQTTIINVAAFRGDQRQSLRLNVHCARVDKLATTE
jgi:outer membrane protein assembly factor BamB